MNKWPNGITLGNSHRCRLHIATAIGLMLLAGTIGCSYSGTPAETSSGTADPSLSAALSISSPPLPTLSELKSVLGQGWQKRQARLSDARIDGATEVVWGDRSFESSSIAVAKFASIAPSDEDRPIALVFGENFKGTVAGIKIGQSREEFAKLVAAVKPNLYLTLGGFCNIPGTSPPLEFDPLSAKLPVVKRNIPRIYSLSNCWKISVLQRTPEESVTQIIVTEPYHSLITQERRTRVVKVPSEIALILGIVAERPWEYRSNSSNWKTNLETIAKETEFATDSSTARFLISEYRTSYRDAMPVLKSKIDRLSIGGTVLLDSNPPKDIQRSKHFLDLVVESYRQWYVACEIASSPRVNIGQLRVAIKDAVRNEEEYLSLAPDVLNSDGWKTVQEIVTAEDLGSF